MWNSKSWPDGMPHQKNGMTASRQAPASTNAREIGFLSKGPLAYFNFRRDAACRVCFRGGDEASPFSTSGIGAGRVVLLHGKINRTETFQEGCRGSLRSTSRTDPGTGPTPKTGCRSGSRFCWVIVLLGSFLAGVQRGAVRGKHADALLLAEFIGWRLLIDAHRIPLAVQFSEK